MSYHIFASQRVPLRFLIVGPGLRAHVHPVQIMGGPLEKEYVLKIPVYRPKPLVIQKKTP